MSVDLDEAEIELTRREAQQAFAEVQATDRGSSAHAEALRQYVDRCHEFTRLTEERARRSEQRDTVPTHSIPGERVFSAQMIRDALGFPPQRAPRQTHGQPCAACGEPIGDSVSDDFCDPVCQRAWQARECSDGYRSPDQDAAVVYVGADDRPVGLSSEDGPVGPDLFTRFFRAAGYAPHGPTDYREDDTLDPRCTVEHCRRPSMRSTSSRGYCTAHEMARPRGSDYSTATNETCLRPGCSNSRRQGVDAQGWCNPCHRERGSASIRVSVDTSPWRDAMRQMFERMREGVSEQSQARMAASVDWMTHGTSFSAPLDFHSLIGIDWSHSGGPITSGMLRHTREFRHGARRNGRISGRLLDFVLYDEASRGASVSGDILEPSALMVLAGRRTAPAPEWSPVPDGLSRTVEPRRAEDDARAAMPIALLEARVRQAEMRANLRHLDTITAMAATPASVAQLRGVTG